MLRFLVCCAGCLILSLNSLTAQQVPMGIPYQAVLRDSSEVLADRDMNLQFTLLQNGLPVYQETHGLRSNGYGLVVTIIGQGEPQSGRFDAIDWPAGALSVQVEAELDDQSKDLGTFPLWSTAYSLYSQQSQSSEQSNYSEQSGYSDSSVFSLRSAYSQSSDSSLYSMRSGSSQVSDTSNHSLSVAPFPLNQLIDVRVQAPDPGAVLTWDGTAWVDQQMPMPQQLYPGAGIAFDDSLVVNLGDLDPLDDLNIGDLAGGDLAGSFPNPQVQSLLGRPLQNAAPSLGQVLKWNGGQWAPGDDANSSSPWSQSGSLLSYSSGNVRIGTGQSAARLNVGGALNGYTSGSSLRYDLSITNDAGQIRTFGPASTNLQLGYYGSNANLPNLSLLNASSSNRGNLGINPNDVGELVLRGTNGQVNIRMNSLLGSSNHGYIGVANATGSMEAGMYVNGSGQGIIFGDQKNFRVPHPTQAGKEIWYGSLEGPELAAYVRGTADLKQGEAWVAFPEHFQLMANAGTMTVTLTPLDRSSEGLAVIEKTAQGFRVAELRNGQGNYSFDWEVKCVRQGREDFQVVRDALEIQPPRD